MASSTTNYHFTLPADSDPASQTPYNENFTSLDTILKTQADGITAVTPTVSTASIDNTALASFFEGTMTGELAAEITGSSALAGVVRAYKTSSTDSIQIAEAIDGTRKTRYYTSSTWSSWA